ncbi:MAG: hypothetical protein WCO84_03755 [bacterium]
MRLINKKAGQTPLEALQFFRNKNTKLASEKLSYIGRLDPMAEGKMIILIGEKENKNREKYLNCDKEYVAEFIIGISTDSLDILGLINKSIAQKTEVKLQKIKEICKQIKKIKSQKYPWFSGKTINGVKMFDIYKSGRIEGLKRPVNKIEIKKISDIKIGAVNKKILQKEILNRINKVNGDFRQEKTKQSWLDFFDKTQLTKFQTISFKIKVSSGTFVRSFSENIEKYLKRPILLYKLKRIKIFA